MRNTFVTNGYAGSLSQVRTESHTDLTENTDLETLTMTITITGAAAMPPFYFKSHTDLTESTDLFFTIITRQLSVEKHEGLFAIRLMLFLTVMF